jgi:hypothetical protein
LVDHDAFNLHAIGERASFVFDTRNAMPEDTAAAVVTLGSLVDDGDESQIDQKAILEPRGGLD